MKTSFKRNGGFTLIELMIVVAIIGILAAIAIPNFLRFQLRAKSSEGKTNIAAIRTAQEGYFAEFNTYVASGITPAVAPGTQKADWPNPSVGCPLCFDTVGWAPEGEVYFQYDTVAAIGAGATAPNYYTASATADIDGDGTFQIWGYVKPDPATVVPGPGTGVASGQNGGAAGAPCAITGVYNPQTTASDLLETVGPCDNTSGQSVF